MINATVEGRICTKGVRIGQLRNDEVSPPQSYVSNTDTEQLCLSLINEFLSNCDNEKNYVPSYIIAENEFGIQKCVCTTLKPQLLPYPSVYDIDGCCSFVSEYMEFEPLEDPCQPPKYLPSPSQVLSWGVGDSFDLSVLLASFLIGSGYDAYVVFGIAPKWICNRDRSNLKFKMDGLDKPYFVESDYSINDQTLQTIMKRLRSIIPKETSLSEILSEDECDSQTNFEEKNDIFYGKRIHCWVAVKANLRSSPGSVDVFVEPSTGERYSVQGDYPYLQVFGMWNNQNYWKNRDINREIDELDIECNNHWESVFFNTSLSVNKHYEMMKERKPFDPPFSWVQCLNIPKESFSFRYPPNGQREIFYNKVKLERFSEGVHKQGLIQRVTIFKDKNMLEVLCCIENFSRKRTDNLISRVRLPHHQSIFEDFSPIHSYSLSHWMEKCGHRRIIKFREKGRADGLLSHDESFGKVLVHTYSGRRDRLYIRTSYLDMVKGTTDKRKGRLIIPTSDGTQNVALVKIVEKFNSPDSGCSERYVVKKIYLLDENKVITDYFKKHRGIDRESKTYVTDPVKNFEQKVLNDEMTAISAVRTITQEISDLVRMRNREEDVLRNDLTLKEDNPSTSAVTSSATDTRIKTDELPIGLEYLAPFLLPGKDVQNLTDDEAKQVYDACLATCRDRLVQRAVIMQTRLREESKNLEDIQKQYEEDGNKTDANKESFEKTLKEVIFRIEVLKQRLQDHEEASVLKYKTLESRLIEDLGLSLTTTP